MRMIAAAVPRRGIGGARLSTWRCAYQRQRRSSGKRVVDGRRRLAPDQGGDDVG
jgi:hypothetical protein